MLHRLIQTIERHQMLAPGQHVAVAVSGGADSVCLLHLLLELAPRWDLRLSVLHLDHLLRGEESRGDAEFVRQLAASLGLPAIIREADVAREAGNLEQAARRARFTFFREVIETGVADRVALAHTCDDQAETVLYRFLRGSGTAGLAGIHPVAESGIVRPLLHCGRVEIEHYLRAHGIPWREDSSNADLRFDRNRIRHGLLPWLAREWNPAIAATLARTADWAQAEEAWWAGEIDRLAATYLTQSDGVTQGVVMLQLDSLDSVPLAARRRLVRRAIERAKGDLRAIDFFHVDAVLDLAASAKGHGRIHLPGVDVLRSFDWIRFAHVGQPRRPAIGAADPLTPEMSIPSLPATIPIPGAKLALSLELIEKSETSDLSHSVYNSEMGCLDWSRLSGFLRLRNWKSGDRYQPISTGSVEKIKTLFQQARIPLWERRNWPILMAGASIVWVRQFGPAAEFAAGPETSTILRIREVEA